MSVKNKYEVKQDYVTSDRSRTNEENGKILFLVAHDTGNPGSTARGNVNWMNSKTKPESSAHAFIDDKEIIEDLPLNEIGWQVRYNVTTDNELFGADANTNAIGTELCYGGSIDFQKAYDKYVWYHARLCVMFDLDPFNDIVGHYKLDPSRRTDPINAFSKNGKTWTQFLKDVNYYVKNWDVSKAEASEDDLTHKVKSGETMYGISRKYHITLDSLKKLNKDVDPDRMQIGEILNIHTKVAAPKQKPRFDLPHGVFKYGARGEEVKEIQSALDALYFRLDVDGIYGKDTVEKMKNFQKVYLPHEVDGIYGENTRRELNKELTLRGLI